MMDVIYMGNTLAGRQDPEPARCLPRQAHVSRRTHQAKINLSRKLELGRTALDAPFGTSCTSREPIWPTVSCGRQPASANFSVDDADEGAVWGGDQQVSDVALVHPLAGGVEVLVGSHGGWAGLHHLGGRGLLGGADPVGLAGSRPRCP